VRVVSFPGLTRDLPDKPDLLLPGRLGWVDSRRGRQLIYGVVLLEVGLVAGFAVVYRPFDLQIYLWGGRAVTSGMRLYLAQAHGNWFTYPPFAAVLFTPLAAGPALAVRLAWELASAAAFGWACVLTLRLAGYLPTRTTVLATVAAGNLLEPVYHTLYLGQVNLFLLALVVADMWRVARGRPAGIGIGLAAAIKLVPGIFIILLVLTRRSRDAITAAVTFACCALIGFAVDPAASRLYWTHLFFDTGRVSAAYISNQSPYAALVRILGGVGHVGSWYDAIPCLLGALGLALATTLARSADWLGATAVTGITGLLVSPISWTHHWVWVLPTLVVLVRYGARGAAGCVYVIFVLAPLWWTPHSGAAGDYGAHGLVTVVGNCFLFAGMGVMAYICLRTWRPSHGSLRLRPRSADSGGIPASDWT
jgi:alpha-1,2-mannosyltransferase